MEIKYWAGTDVGRKRSDNEDNFLIDKRLRLFVVADGMGGHASGEIASAMAVHGIREVLHAERDILDVYDDDDPKSHVEVCTLLEYAVHYTCAQIFHKARREPEKRGMGTTLVVLLLIGARGFIAYVGDSRIYLLRGGVVYQLTEDHSLRNELIRMGKITADEFESSPYANLKNAMTRAVGVYESVEVDTLDFDIIAGDAFLMCSDGLYEYLTDEDIAHAIALPEIREVPGMLIDAANSRGGKDNITAVVVQVAGSASDDDRAAELNFTLDTLKTVPLFRELSYQQLVRVINLSRQSALEPGQVLCREGEPGHELMVVVRGRVELTQGGVRVAELGAGSHLGEMSLIDEGLRSVTVTALDTGKVLAIGRDDFYEVLRREPALAVKLLWSFVRVLAGRLRATTADLAVARTRTSPARPDLTELAEETTRARVISADVAEEIDADEAIEDDELERRTTMISGMLGGPSVPLDARTTLVRTTAQTPGERAPAAPPEPPRAEPERSRAGTGSARKSDTVAPTDESVMSSAKPGPRGGGSVEGGEAVVSRARGSSNPSVAGDVVATPHPRPSSNPSITGDTIVPPSSAPRPRVATRPIITGDTMVPPSATPRPRAPSSPAAASEPPPTPARPAPPGAGATPGELATPPRAATPGAATVAASEHATPPRPATPSAAAASSEPATPPRPATAGGAAAASEPAMPPRPAPPGAAAASGPATPPRPAAPPRPATPGPAAATSGEPAPPRAAPSGSGSSPVISGELGSPRPASTSPADPPPSRSGSPRPASTSPAEPAPSRSGSSPVISGELGSPSAASTGPGDTAPSRSAPQSPIVPGELVPSRPLPPTSPMISGDLPLPRTAASNPAITGDTVVPPSAAPRPRRAPQVTKPNESSWSPGTHRPVVPSPQAPTAPLDAPHLHPPAPPAETDAPKSRRTGRRSAMPQMPGTPFAPQPPVPAPIHSAPTAPLAAPAAGAPSSGAPTAPLSAPVVGSSGAPTAPLAAPAVAPPPAPPTGAPTAPLVAPMVPPLSVPTAPLAAPPVPPDVPSHREDAITAPVLPVAPPPPPPPRGGTMPPPGRGGTMPPPSRADADSDAPRVPAPRHARATPQAGGTLPPPSADASDTRRTQTGMPVVPPPPPTTRKGGTDPDDPATSTEPGS